MSTEELIIKIQKGELGAKNELWEHIGKIVYRYINRYTDYARKHLSEPDELISVAWFGVERAIKDYKPDKEYKFNTYLRYYVNNVIREFFGFRGIKRIKPISLDVPLNDETEQTILDTIEDEGSQQGFEDVERKLIGEFVDNEVRALKPKYQEVIRGVYYYDKTQIEIAERIGCSGQYVSTLQHEALRVLRNNKRLQEYCQEFAYKPRGYKTFNTTWTSSTEWAVIRLEELRERDNIRDNKLRKSEQKQ